MDRRYALFVLTNPFTPFEQDHTGLRGDGPRRAWMHQRCLEYAQSTAAQVVEVAGSPGERVGQAVGVIDGLILHVRAS